MKYFLYCRKSSDSEDRQMLSIEAQLQELRDYALKNNLEVIKEFTESKTAKKPGREVFNKMISEIETGKADGIIAWNPDRLARNSVDGGRIIYLRYWQRTCQGSAEARLPGRSTRRRQDRTSRPNCRD